MWFARIDAGWLIGGLSAEALTTLQAVPLLIASRDPRVLERLAPTTYEDEEQEREWRRNAGEDLRHLFASREELVRGDLERMREPLEGRGKMLLIPDPHVSGWLAALNAARLALYALNDFEPGWMAGKERERMSAAQRTALARIRFLAHLQSILLGDHEPPAAPSGGAAEGTSDGG